MAALRVAQAYGKYGKDGITWEEEDSSSGDTIFHLDKGYIGENRGYAIYYFGIQTLPGVQFNINSNKTTAESIIQIGQTGIFELNLFDKTPIEKITFENLSDKLSENVSNNGVNYCLIDLIYEKTS